MEVMEMRLMVVALEFGMTNSGLAFSMKSKFETDPLDIHFLIRNSSSFRSVRTPTCLLLNNEKQYVAFGYDAENRYAELVMDEEHANYYFFDRFTMSLHNKENVTRDMVLKDKTGKQCSAVDVFTLSIKGAVDDLMKMVDRNATGLIYDDDILWVLTVPATWTDSAKQLMRESAKQAGLQAENVLLITEPEAAFTYCHYTPTTEIQGSKPGIMIKEPGTKSMVVDLGGVTADITVLQQTYNGQLKVLCRATEDDCGGTSVDDRFCKMLEEIVGGNVITRVKRQDPADWFEMLKEFRSKIERFMTSNTKFTFKFAWSLDEICKELHGKDFASVLGSSSYVNKITLCADKLRVKADLVIKTSTIDSIITLMKNTVSNRSTNGVSNNVSNIIIVGGFSQCPMIQDAVYKAFPDNQIIIPYHPGVSVLKGAVLFGHRPDYIRSELCDEEGIGK